MRRIFPLPACLKPKHHRGCRSRPAVVTESCWALGFWGFGVQEHPPTSTQSQPQPEANRSHWDERLPPSDLFMTKSLRCHTVFCVNTYFIFQNRKRYEYFVPWIPGVRGNLATPHATRHAAARHPAAHPCWQAHHAAFHLQIIYRNLWLSSPLNFRNDKRNGFILFLLGSLNCPVFTGAE